MKVSRASFTCPDCGATSYNPHDVADRYCGRCHRRPEVDPKPAAEPAAAPTASVDPLRAALARLDAVEARLDGLLDRYGRKKD